MKKTIMLLVLATTGSFCFAQNNTDSAYTGGSDSARSQVVIQPEPNGPTKAGLAKAIETGTIYNSTSPYHNVLHDYTYLVVMQDASHSFGDFGDFVADLGTRLNGTTVMLGFTATGSYDGDTNVFTARSIVVVLK